MCRITLVRCFAIISFELTIYVLTKQPSLSVDFLFNMSFAKKVSPTFFIIKNGNNMCFVLYFTKYNAQGAFVGFVTCSVIFTYKITSRSIENL